ncbi:Fic family protein [Candidatus Uhrbacteria bacterium]|nr:Fic family protein [Candidatus Uhrbacteria bacterium]
MDYPKIDIPQFNFDSPLTNLVIRLDHLRTKQLTGTTPAPVFFDLKRLFHILESVQSARIEGNRTTIAEIIDSRIEKKPVGNDEQFREIENIEKALQFIDENVIDFSINRLFISHLHKLVVDGLTREGSSTPGQYRKGAIAIQNSPHQPPDGIHVQDLMDELVVFIHKEDDKKYDLLKIAIAHHRFTWIHPFDNGNGRMSRLITYAMLVKFGFNVDKSGRVLNPTGLFCTDRQKYYDMLGDADVNGNAGMVNWCIYVLEGLVVEMEKIDKLANYEYLSTHILTPAIQYAQKVGSVSAEEYLALKYAVDKSVLTAGGLKEVFPDYYPVKLSRFIADMKQKHFLLAYPNPNSKSYVMSFSQNKLLRYVARELMDKGFILSEDKESL